MQGHPCPPGHVLVLLFGIEWLDLARLLDGCGAMVTQWCARYALALFDLVACYLVLCGPAMLRSVLYSTELQTQKKPGIVPGLVWMWFCLWHS